MILNNICLPLKELYMADDQPVPSTQASLTIGSSIERLLASSDLAYIPCGNRNAFLIAAPKLSGGCVLFDFRLPDTSSRRVRPRLIELETWLPVIVITTQNDISEAMHFIRSSSTRSRERPYDDDTLCEAINLALAHCARVDSHSDPQSAASRLRALTPRERAVLVALAAGQSNKNIADNLGLSVRTIEGHRARMMKRLGVRQFAEAIRLAVTAELVSA